MIDGGKKSFFRQKITSKHIYSKIGQTCKPQFQIGALYADLLRRTKKSLLKKFCLSTNFEMTTFITFYIYKKLKVLYKKLNLICEIFIRIAKIRILSGVTGQFLYVHYRRIELIVTEVLG